MKTSQKGIDLIKHFESLHDGDLTLIGLQPKLCPANYWTEGYGSLVLDDKGKRIKGCENKAMAYKFSKISTIEQAEEKLNTVLKLYESKINDLIFSFALNVNQNQFDAVISFCYNLGLANFKNSTLLKKIQEVPQSMEDIKYQFSRWNKVGDKVLHGLVLRRAAEAELFSSAPSILNNMSDNIKDLEPEFSKTVDENFWELI